MWGGVTDFVRIIHWQSQATSEWGEIHVNLSDYVCIQMDMEFVFWSAQM
jgi:hypothetical protein